MDNNINFAFNPRRYADNLSPFGIKVLNTLVQKWKSDRSQARNAFQQRFSASIQKKRVLHFRDKESLIRLPLSIEAEMNQKTSNGFHDDNPFDSNIMDRRMPQYVPTTVQLVKTVDTSEKIIVTDDINLSSHDLINPVRNDRIVFEPNTKTSDKNLTISVDLPGSNYRVSDNNVNDIDWDNMFDTELFSEEIKTNTEIFLKNIEIPVENNFKIEFPCEVAKKRNKTKTRQLEYKMSAKEITKSKRKNQTTTDVNPKKVKVISEIKKNSFRKQSYTKAVRNWLGDVDANNPVIKDEVVGNKSREQHNRMEQIEMLPEKVKENPNKKIIQAQLVNKDGIMKYTKPKLEKTRKHENDSDKTDESVKTIDENVAVVKNKAPENKAGNGVTKDKKNKQKFIAPIKSQIPIKDVEFRVLTINEDNIKDHTDTLRCMKNEDVVTVLVYSNGFSQLNNHHTEDKCSPEGFIISIRDDFLYFQGEHIHKETIQALLENNRILCYEGKHLLIYLKSKFDVDIHNVEIIDSKVGGSLLDPDSPPENFSDLQKLLSFTPQFTIATECVLQKIAWYATLLKECTSKLTSLLMEDQLWNIFVDVEMKLIPIIAEMERRGISVDLEKLKAMEQILLSEMKAAELACHKAAGKAFQINSHVQVRALIYDELQLDAKCNIKIRETISKGAKSTSESMLRSLVSVHPLPKLILEYRHLHKAHATFLTGIAQHVREGIVRPTWVQTAAATGRIASNNPNLQAIPKAPFSLVLFPPPRENDTEGAAEELRFRSLYSSRAGYSLVAADFRHVECRVLAHAAGDARLLAALRARDLFRELAAAWLGKPERAVSAADRERTKRIVYASLYGAGRRKLMDLLDVSYDQALAVAASFHRSFPALKSFGRSVVARCAARGGRLATLCGRARRFANISSDDFALRSQAERQAVNFVVQGSAADLCKKAMLQTAARLRAHCPAAGGTLLLQIHDELVWEIRDQHLRTAAVIIKEVMEGCGYENGMATLPVSICVGKNWGEMTEYLSDE